VRLNFKRIRLFVLSSGFACLTAYLGSSSTCLAEKPDLKRYNGKIIGDISIEIVPIFEDSSLGMPYSTANSLKFDTKESTIRQELAFHPGDTFNAFAVSETLRRLRALRYLRHASILPTERGEFVDVKIIVQDTWTLIPQVSVSSGAGNGSQSVGFAESNLFGLGKRAEISLTQDEKREILETVYEDPRFMGGDTRLVGGYFHRSDGREAVFYYGLPFRTLVDPLSWHIAINDDDSVGRLFEDADESYIYRRKSIDVLPRYKISTQNNESEVRRYTFGFDFQESRFYQATLNDYDDLDLDPAQVSNDPRLLPQDRRFVGPNFGFEFIEPDFISMNYIDRFERVEDYNLGTEHDVAFTIAPESFGSDYDALLFSFNRSQGHSFDPDSFIRGEIGIGGRVESEGLVNNIARAEVKYYNILGELKLLGMNLGRHTLATNFSTEYGHELDGDRQLSLGADNGLRGFDARTFNGDKRVLANIEDRIHLADNVYDLVSLGLAGFIDVGGATYDNYGSLFQENLNADFGVGLRFAFPRSSGGRVLRVDIAAPFNDGPDGSSDYQFRVVLDGGQIFSSRLRSESEGAEAANVSVGFER
jgi:outer membrane protein assembly factor BamA